MDMSEVKSFNAEVYIAAVFGVLDKSPVASY